MNLPKLLSQSRNIVLIGKFDPKQYQPCWFLENELIGKDSGKDLRVQILQPGISLLKTDWMDFQCDVTRMMVSTDQEAYFEVIRDLLIGSIAILKSTPIQMFGINSNLRFKMESQVEWHQVGHILAPKAIWNSFLKEPGMKAITLKGSREDDLPGHLNISVEPIPSVDSFEVGLLINDHFETGDSSKMVDAEEFLDMFPKAWKSAEARSKQIPQDFWSNICRAS